LEKHGNKAVCFGLTKNGRIPMSISQLINIKDSLMNSLEAIQLYRYSIDVNNRVSVRAFGDYLYYYNAQGHKLFRAPISSPNSLERISHPTIEVLIEEKTREILDIMKCINKRVVLNIMLVFALEEKDNLQLWLLGATKIYFQSKGRRLSARESLTSNSFMLASKKYVNNIGVQSQANTFLKGDSRYKMRSVSTKKLRAQLNSFMQKCESRTRIHIKQYRKSLEESVKEEGKINHFKTLCNRQRELLTHNKPQKETTYYSSTNQSRSYISLPSNKKSIRSRLDINLRKRNYKLNKHPLQNCFITKADNYCVGDFCRTNHSDTLYPIDELLIALERTKLFTPKHNEPALNSRELNIGQLLQRIRSKAMIDIKFSNKIGGVDILKSKRVVKVCGVCMNAYMRVAQYMLTQFCF